MAHPTLVYYRMHMTGILRAQHHVIYVPGLGDKNVFAQQLAVMTWRAFGLYGHCHPVIWSNTESFDDKLQGLVREIDELHREGYIVSLVGSSAGASMTLHAFAERKDTVAAVVLICGALGDVKTIDRKYFDENPAFKVSMQRLPATLKKLYPEDRLRVMSIRPWYDEKVKLSDMNLDGARMFSSISFGHAATIGMTLTIDFFIPYWFLAKWARKTS